MEIEIIFAAGRFDATRFSGSGFVGEEASKAAGGSAAFPEGSSYALLATSSATGTSTYRYPDSRLSQ